MSPVVLINSTIASNSSSWEQIGWQRTLPDNSCNKTTRPFTNGVTNTKYFKQRALYRNLTFWRRQNFKPQPHDWEIEHVMLKKAKETFKQIMPYPLARNFASFNFKWPSWFDNVLFEFWRAMEMWQYSLDWSTFWKHVTDLVSSNTMRIFGIRCWNSNFGGMSCVCSIWCYCCTNTNLVCTSTTKDIFKTYFIPLNVMNLGFTHGWKPVGFKSFNWASSQSLLIPH